MIRKLGIVLLCLLVNGAAAGQDALNLPTELYVLTNSGQVQRYGLGAEGITVVSPEEAFVLDFAIAPDGSTMAYRTETGLYLTNVHMGGVQPLDEGTASIPYIRGRGETLVWSPSGDMLVYTTITSARGVYLGADVPIFFEMREANLLNLSWSPGGEYLAAEAEDTIWWLYRRDGATLTLTSAIPSSVGLAWVGVAQIVFAPETGGLFHMDLAAANTQTTLLDDTTLYAMPYLLPDGGLAAFARAKDDANVPEGSGAVQVVNLQTLEVFPVGQGVVDLNGLRWSPDGQLLIALRGGVMALVIPITGQGLTLPVSDAVTFGWGPLIPRVTSVTLPADGYFITTDTNDIAQVWRLPADGSPPAPVTSAEANITVYELSPEGRRIAYASGGSLWLQPLNDTTATEALAEVGEAGVESISFSPDGGQIAYALADSGVWLVDAVGGEPENVLVNGVDTPVFTPAPVYSRPIFSPNTNALLAAVRVNEVTVFALLDLNTREAIDTGGWDEAFWLRDGRMLAYGNGVNPPGEADTQAIYAVDLATNIRTELTAPQFPARVAALREISAGRVRVVLGSFLPVPGALEVVDIDTETGTVTPVGGGGFVVNPVLSPDGTTLAGQVYPGGPLHFYDLVSGQQMILSEPQSVSQFRWGG